jgi:CubicO group peptidase (beta-lactamase class C family)
MVRDWKEEVFYTEPGQIYSYSSAGYWLAGYVIEELAAKPYADAMSELLFQPLGMGRTTFRPHMAMTYPLAIGHAAQGREEPAVIRPAFNNVAMWPAGSIFSSVGELARFVIAFMNGGRGDGKQALSPSLISQLEAPHVAIPGEQGSHYGYGLMIFPYRGVRVVGHGGFSRGYGSMIQMVPEHRFAVIVLTNKSGVTLSQTVGKAMELGLPLQAESAERPATARPLTPAEVADFAGTYAHPPLRWEIFATDGKLWLRREGAEYPLTKIGDQRFTFGQDGEEIVLVPGPDGKIEYLFSNLYSAKKVRLPTKQ